jgi:hypothetical protein
MENVRELVIEKDCEIEAPEHFEPVPLPSWNKCPCAEISLCDSGTCIGYVKVRVVVGKSKKWIYLEIVFFKSRRHGFIRADNSQLLELFSIGFLTYESLEDCLEEL